MTLSNYLCALLAPLALSMTVLGSGCDQPADEAPRGSWEPSGKADAAASCEGFCGDMAPAGCWCDDECAGYGDCCSDIAPACDMEPECPNLSPPPPNFCASPDHVEAVVDPNTGCVVSFTCLECVDALDCSSGEACTPEGTCVPMHKPQDCYDTLDCSSGEVCTPEGTCVPMHKPQDCYDSLDCSGGDVCTPEGICVPLHKP